MEWCKAWLQSSLALLFSVLAIIGTFVALSAIADALFLSRYMRSFLIERNRVIKATAESGDWQSYIRDV